MNNKPIYIYEGGGLNPGIIGTIDTDPYATHDSRALFAKMSKRVNNVTALEVTTSANSEAAKTITNTSDLVVYDNQGEVHEFHITELVYTDEYSQELQIYAEESICELVNNIVTGEGQAFPTTKNPSDYLNYILFYTRFTVGIVDTGIYDSQWKEDITGKNCLEALQLFIEKYNCEFQVRYTTDNKNRITGRYIDIKTKIGNSYGKRFEDDKDILKLSQKLNLDSVKTAIYPRIAKTVTNEETGESETVYEDISSVEWSVAAGNPCDKPLGQTILINPDADNMLRRLNTKNGRLMERVMYAEWNEESCPNGPESLIGQAWAILRANGVLVPSLEVSATDLYRLSGENPDYSHELVGIGDDCTIVDKSFDDPIRLELRVMEIYEDLLNPVNTEYNFGKYRRTLATSNLEQQKTMEEKMKQLESKVKGITVTGIEAKPQYQSGKPYYESMKELIQNEFISSSGYVMIDDSDGLWVFNKPADQEPTKAAILKGGNLTLAEYNIVTSEWEVGTFIDGLSVNADMINTGHINADVIAAGSITANHLSVAAVEYLKTGMATDEDLQDVIDSIASTYVSSETLGTQLDTAVQSAVTTSNKESYKQAMKAITTEYKNNYKQANTLLNNSYLTGDAKSNLQYALDSYSARYNSGLVSAYNAIANADTITPTMITNYNTAITNLQSATEVLAQRVQEAVSAINTAVKSEATAYADNLKVDIDTDIQDVADSVNMLEGTMNGAFKDGIITQIELSSIKADLNTLQREMADVNSEYNSLINNSNLLDPAKSDLQSKKNAYEIAGKDLISTINTVVEDGTATEAEKSTITQKMNAYKDALSAYRTSASAAIDSISSNKILNASISEGSMDMVQNAINNAIQGLATESYVDSKLTASEAKQLVNTIKELQSQLEIEYHDVLNRVSVIYGDQYLSPGTAAKTELATAIQNYKSAYADYNNKITEIIADNQITTEEYNSYVSLSNAYGTALKNLDIKAENANNARLANVYAQARQGLVTTAELEVNNDSVVQRAQQGMVNTGDLTSAISIAKGEIADDYNIAISTATENLVSTETLTNEINGTKKESVKSVMKSINNEYAYNKQMVDTLYSNTNLTGDAKTNLNTAKNDYTSAYNTLVAAYNTFYKASELTDTIINSWNNALDSFKSAGSTLAKRVEEAKQAIEKKVLSDSKEYTNTTKTQLDSDIADVNNAVSDLNTTMNGAFKDGVISSAEAKAIQSNLKMLGSEYSDVYKEYMTLSSNSYLTGTPKNNLNTAWGNYNSAFVALKNAINSVVEDSLITDDERTAVDEAYATHNTALANYREAVNAAIDAIAEAKVDEGTKDLVNKDTMNDAIEEAVKDKVDTTTMNDAINSAVSSGIDSMIIGTRNLALATKDEWNGRLSLTEGSVQPNNMKFKVLTSGLSAGDKLLVAFDYKIENATYSTTTTPAISFKGNGDVTGSNSGMLPSTVLYPKEANQSGTVYKIHNVTEAMVSNNYWSGVTTIQGFTGGDFYIARVRVVKSSRLVEWTAAPEDAYVESIRRSYQAITVEYKKNKSQAEELYKNKYLKSTAKTGLRTAIDNYASDFNSLTSARNAIINAQYGTIAMNTAWNDAVVAMQSSTEALGEAVSIAGEYINTAVYNASVQYFEDTIPDKLTGYAKTSYVDEAKQAAITAAKEGMVSTTELTTQVDAIVATTASMGQYNLLRNTDFRSGMDFWSVYKSTESSADKVSIETNDKDKSGMMSGERALCIWGTAAETGNKNIVAYQDVVLTPGVSYTLAYWVNCSDCSMKMSIKSVNASNVVSEVAQKTYKNINGDHNRTTWKYDSLSFTVPSGSTKIRVAMTLTNATTGTYRAFLVKPMLSTGINAQAWTGHPDEMHIGVVSITEEKGIMVEHSDTSTYTTLNSEGLQVWERESATPIAYFGEGKSAYVPTLSTDMVYSKSVTPQLYISEDITIYFSDSGSGSATGADASNPARGFTGAMEILCERLGIDSSYVTGGFTVTSATIDIKTIKFIAVGTDLYSGIYLQNISGAVSIEIEFPKNMALRGSYVFRCISCPIWIYGNKTSIVVDDGAIVKRVYDSNASSFNSGMLFYNCSAVEVNSMRFFCADNSHQAGIEIWYSNVYIGNLDIKGWAHGIYISQESTVNLHNVTGSSGATGVKVNNSILVISGATPRVGNSNTSTVSRDYIDVVNASMIGTGAQAPNAVGSIQGSYTNTSRSFNIKGSPIGYESIRGKYKMKDLYQGNADLDATDKYVGRVYLPDTFRDAMISATGIAMAIRLQRREVTHGDESADVYIDGNHVGALKLNQAAWFNLPDDTIAAIKSGTRNYIELNGTSYIMFDRDAQISLSATKTV